MEMPMGRDDVEEVSLGFAQMTSVDNVEQRFEPVHALRGGGFRVVIAILRGGGSDERLGDANGHAYMFLFPLLQRGITVTGVSLLVLEKEVFDDAREELLAFQIRVRCCFGQHVR